MSIEIQYMHQSRACQVFGRAKYHSADPTAFCKCYTVLNLDRPISLKAGEQCHLFNYTTTFLNPLSPDLICQRSCSCTASRGHRKAISLDSCLRCVFLTFVRTRVYPR